MSLFNILINSIQKRNFSVIVKKIFKRFEKDSSVEANKWAYDNSISIDDYCNKINPHIWQESVEACNQIELQGRPAALKRSFENIIQNGLTYGSKVYVDIQKGNNRALITIDDDGPGIPEDQYKNVFKPFFRLDKSRSLNQAGVGLGLAIVEDIINSHGGSIQLSKSKLNGLQVKVSLPF